MVTKVKSLSLALAGLAALAAALAVGASGAGGTFVEPDVRVLHQFDSSGPAPGGSYFGWAVSELGDVDGDGVKEAIVGEPANGADSSTGTTYVYSGRTGRLIYRFDGAPGDQNGFAMADAGDTNRDHVHDILVGSPGNGAGHVDLYSGRTGKLLHRFEGASAGDAFGWSVSSAGDVDRDHHADVLIGATQAPPTGTGPGYATIYSGRTYEPIRTLTGDATGNQFGSGAGWSRDVDRDHVADQIVGARNAGAGTARPGVRLLRSDGQAALRDQRLAARRRARLVLRRRRRRRERRPDARLLRRRLRGHDERDRRRRKPGRPRGRLLGTRRARAARLARRPREAGLGPGRGAGDVNGDGRPDLVVGSYTSNAGAPAAGKVQIFSGADGSLLRTITSTVENDNLGFDAVGLGDTNHDGIPDELLSAANGNHVYIVAGNKLQQALSSSLRRGAFAPEAPR